MSQITHTHTHTYTPVEAPLVWEQEEKIGLRRVARSQQHCQSGQLVHHVLATTERKVAANQVVKQRFISPKSSNKMTKDESLQSFLGWVKLCKTSWKTHPKSLTVRSFESAPLLEVARPCRMCLHDICVVRTEFDLARNHAAGSFATFFASLLPSRSL